MPHANRGNLNQMYQSEQAGDRVRRQVGQAARECMFLGQKCGPCRRSRGK